MRRRRASPGRVVLHLALVLLAAFFLMPVYMMLVTALKEPAAIDLATAWEPPRAWHWASFAQAWWAFLPKLRNSFVLTVAAATASALLGSLNGYVFAKWPFPGSRLVFAFILFGMFIPYQAVMIPLQGMLLSVEGQVPWFQGIVKLIIVHTIFGIPICTLIFRNYYATAVPKEMLEAARIDGAGMLKTYRSIILPLSMPAFVVTLIWQFTSAWNDFLFALFLTTRQNGPVTYALNELAGGQNPDYPSIMAGVLLASLPTLLVYILLGRYFIGGLMSGSVK